jgi:hypothetical protein
MFYLGNQKPKWLGRKNNQRPLWNLSILGPWRPATIGILVYILEIKKNHPIDIEPYVEIDLW